MSNETAKKFDEHVGFIQEGVIREAFEDGEDAILYGMLRSECRYLGVHHG
jgi:RimJ/RimL family protein N-acetyltransferase